MGKWVQTRGTYRDYQSQYIVSVFKVWVFDQIYGLLTLHFWYYNVHILLVQLNYLWSLLVMQIILEGL